MRLIFQSAEYIKVTVMLKHTHNLKGSSKTKTGSIYLAVFEGCKLCNDDLGHQAIDN